MGALSDLRKKQQLPNERQRLVLETLAQLDDEDTERDVAWRGAFGAGPVAARLGIGHVATGNDLDRLKELGYVEPELNLLYRITEKGRKFVNDGKTDDSNQ